MVSQHDKRLENLERPAAENKRSSAHHLFDPARRARMDREAYTAERTHNYRQAEGHINDEYKLTRDLLRLWRIRGNLPRDINAILQRVWDWPHKYSASGPDRVKDRGEIARAVMRAIWEDDPKGMADLVCDAAWRECFETEAELVRRLRSIPPEEHARIVAAFGQNDARMVEDAYRRWEQFGVTEEMFEAAIGPPEVLAEITEQKYGQRYEEIALQFELSSEGYATHLALKALVMEHPEILER